MGVETHPGPEHRLHVGVLNARSAVNKAAPIHDQIFSDHLDVFVLTETHFPFDAPPAIRDDFARPGFSVIHAPRVGRK